MLKNRFSDDIRATEKIMKREARVNLDIALEKAKHEYQLRVQTIREQYKQDLRENVYAQSCYRRAGLKKVFEYSLQKAEQEWEQEKLRIVEYSKIRRGDV